MNTRGDFRSLRIAVESAVDDALTILGHRTHPQHRHAGARSMAPLILTRYTVVSALGKGLDETYQALRNRRSGLRPCDFEDVGITTYIGRVDDVEDVFVGGGSTSTELERFDCRNNRLALLGLQQDGFIQAAIEARERYGAHRVAVILGSSTSGILETEHAYCHRDPATGALPSSYLTSHRYTHNMFSVRAFCAHIPGAAGTGDGHLHGLLVQREGVCHGGTIHRSRILRCGGGRRRG